ncbi:hypothetical protein Syun_025087 [Stephania yunnanensis]|uniref:Zinc finger CCCH-type with G patch domain-containing protein n=1 Tax=Stephania yunnanensis TaxID=152371 RepID=A0AAP0EWB6_9MAGN
MANGEEEDEAELEQQLELQLEEQRDSLNALNEALASDPSNSELLSFQEELIVAIRDSEDGLLHLKRSRLLRETDSILSSAAAASGCGFNGNDVKVEALDPQLEAENYGVGSKCRFRHIDGRWYNGVVVSVDGTGSATIAFLTPTSENMVICKFFLQQRCRFGSNCRMSHGVDVPLSSLKAYIPTIWQQSFVGSIIWALPDSNSGVWKEAELESFDDIKNLAKVVFRNDGSSTTLGIEAVSLSEYAEMSEDEEDEYSTEQSDSTDDEEEEEIAPQGLGFLEATHSQRGIQTDTAVFANWEHHTRGIASKMMANMGYREGMGLGASGQGRVDPISVKVLKPKQSLDHALQSHEGEKAEGERKKKRSRGGKRKRDKKFADAARAAKQEEESQPDVFSFINKQLATQVQAHGGTTSKNRQSKGSVEGRKEDRRALVAYDDEVKDLRLQIEKLEEMVGRNRKDKVTCEAFTRKLNETRKALADAEAAHASASHALVSKEKEKKWLKF